MKKLIAGGVAAILGSFLLTGTAYATPNVFTAGVNKYHGLLSPVSGKVLPDLSYSVSMAQAFQTIMQQKGIYVNIHTDDNVVLSNLGYGGASEGANLSYVVGHGYPTGWVIGQPDANDPTKAAQAHTGNFSFGINGHLKWMTFDACTVLEADNGFNISRWDSSFVGLHSMTGSTTTINDLWPDRGNYYASYLNNTSYTVKSAWFAAVNRTDSIANPAIYAIAGNDSNGTWTDTSNDQFSDAYVKSISRSSMIFIQQ